MTKKTIFAIVLALVATLSIQAQDKKVPAGYTYGTPQVSKSPFSLEEFKLLQQSMLFGE